MLNNINMETNQWAFLDDNNIVVEVIPGRNEDEVVDGISDW